MWRYKNEWLILPSGTSMLLLLRDKLLGGIPNPFEK
jgi:hypothetical protein